MSFFIDNQVMYIIYWAALTKEYSLQEWAVTIRHMYGSNLDYPFKEAVNIIEKYKLQGL